MVSVSAIPLPNFIKISCNFISFSVRKIFSSKMLRFCGIAVFILFITVQVFGEVQHPKDSTVRNGDAELPPRSDRADIKTLELVQIMWRHGDRTPIVQYPNDPLNDVSLWKNYASGFESITKKGKMMHYQFGKYLRERYDGFLSAAYSPSEIYVQSSDADRAIMSAMSNMAGMWPPTPEDPKSEWNAQLPWQPVPVHTIPKKLDNLINFGAECPRFEELKHYSIHDSPFAKSINEDANNTKLCEYVKGKAGVKECDFEVISDIWDTLRIQKWYNMTLPDWVDPVFDHMAQLAPLFFDSRVIVPNDEAKRVKAGPLLNFLVKNMDLRRNAGGLTATEKKKMPRAKMYVLSGHDTTSSIALGAIDVFQTQFPPYASAAIFEMHKTDKPNVHHVRVFFRNETAVPPFEFKIPKCGFPCTVDKFKEVFAPIIVDNDQWKEACKSDSKKSATQKRDKSSAQSVSSWNWTFLIPIITTLWFHSHSHQ